MAKISFTSGKSRERTEGRRSVDDVLGEVGGPSPRGSSYYKLGMICWREFALVNVARLRPVKTPDHFAIGTIYHKALEVFYRTIMLFQQDLDAAGHARNDHYYFGGTHAASEAAWGAIAAFATEPGYSEVYEIVSRILGAYLQNYWGFDKWRVLAVEETLRYQGDDEFDYSARLDLLVEWNGFTWSVEHKTARSVSVDSLDHYDMDLQTLGQQWLYERCVDISQFAPFGGIVVNIVTKAKEPKFFRRDVCPSPAHLAMFQRAISHWIAMRDAAEAQGWPQALGHCSGAARGYGRCSMYDVCRNWPGLSVEQIAANPPDGFVVAEEDAATGAADESKG